MKVHLHRDDRGHLHSIKNLPFAPREILVSRNKQGSLKGLHQSPYRKIVYVSSGRIHDFYVVTTPASASTWQAVASPASNTIVERELKAGEWLEVPALGAHGFFCPEDSLVVYLLEDEYDASCDRTIYWKSPEYAFAHAFLKEYGGGLILSPKDEAALYATEYDYLVLGAHGFLGQEVVKALRTAGRKVLASGRGVLLDHQEAICDMLTRSRAKYVVCAAGISGKPTIQWSEDHEPETFETNLLDVCNLIRLCRDRGRHLTYLGSGLVYSSISAVKLVSDGKRAETVAATAAAAASTTTIYSDVSTMAPRTEQEQPDLVAKVYCRYRVMLEDIIRRVYPTDLLYLRLIYPCTFDGHPKCFFQKMLGRTSNVNNVAVSLTVVPDLFPLLPMLIEEKRATGILNFVSPGAIELPALLATAGVKHSVAPTPSTPLASEVLCTHKLCELLGGDAAADTGKTSKIPSLAESMPRYVARYLQSQELQQKHASHGPVGARA